MKHTELVEALTGRFDDHHAELARILLDEIDGLTAKVDRLTRRVDELLARIPGAQAIIAEVGLNMAQFPTAGHLVSWAKVSPRNGPARTETPIRSDGQGQPLPEAGPRRGRGFGGKDRHVPRRALSPHRPSTGQAAGSCGGRRSILVVIWQLLSDPNARFIDLGSDFYDQRINKDHRAQDLVRHLHALGYQVTLSSAA